ncbi:hypothetical protein H2O73_02225 [Vibrio sp. 404]|uniref:Uncharacterized protein n=1 Tax=Vibrio marinisediminis TaxID=2758441 RepID=A0A7W2FN47_9VIBR|nr:hypothetical protein [Vibrio marinisediminis]MBA5761145.1 hypothetical protein [Vibrio marinisediminis]
MEALKAQLNQAGIKHREVSRYSIRVPLGMFTNNATVIYDVAKGSYRIRTNRLLLLIIYSVLLFNGVHSYIYSNPTFALPLAALSLFGYVTILLTEVQSRPLKVIINNLNQSLSHAVTSDKNSLSSFEKQTETNNKTR